MQRSRLRFASSQIPHIAAPITGTITVEYFPIKTRPGNTNAISQSGNRGEVKNKHQKIILILCLTIKCDYAPLPIGKIDLILCDWVMPKVSGLEVVKFVKSSDDFKHIPIIMITAEATRENVVQAIQAGIDDYMVKPFKPFALLAKIEKMFAEEE